MCQIHDKPNQGLTPISVKNTWEELQNDKKLKKSIDKKITYINS